MTVWVRFRSRDGHVGFGILGDGVIREHGGDLFGTPQPTAKSWAVDQVNLLSPCVPSKMVALWNNFHALAAKLGKAPPRHPLFLLKPGTCLIGPDEQIRRPKSYPGKIAYEGELGIVIGRECKDVPVDEAARFIFGYTCVNDVTAAEVLNENADFAQWCRSKGYDTFGAVGPAINTDLDWTRASVVTRLDGQERQNYPLSDLILSPAELVSNLSQDMTLLPGDVIAVGTSLGIGSIKDGSTVEVTIDGIGSLRNRLAAS